MVIVDIGQLALGFAIVFAAYVAGQRLKGWFQYKAKLDALHWMTKDAEDGNATESSVEMIPEAIRYEILRHMNERDTLTEKDRKNSA